MASCDTLIRIETNGLKLYKPKKVYENQDDAIEAAKILNSLDHRINKVVPYRCGYCKKFHLGRNGKEIKEKDRKKLKKQLAVKIPQPPKLPEIPNVKVIGWIDLSKIKY